MKKTILFYLPLALLMHHLYPPDKQTGATNDYVSTNTISRVGGGGKHA